jgi:hypothetical protein
MYVNIQKKTLIFLIFLELILFIISFSFFPQGVFAGVSEGNVTVITNLTVGNVYPEISNVSVENNLSSFALIPNSSRTIFCWGLVTDYNGWDDVQLASATFFDNVSSSYAAADDNNNHYANSSCSITQLGTYTNWVNCSINIQYYANPGVWTCTILANDTKGKGGYGSDTINISSLLALGLPDILYYGEVNATEVSAENITSVTNYGNVKINLSLSGYGFRLSDGNAMNCTIGAVRNISIGYEKYNLTASTPGILNLTQFNQTYLNLTSAPVVKRYNLDFRQNDTFNEAINATYWRIYVPLGVAGTCQGNIVFGATVASGT